MSPYKDAFYFLGGSTEEAERRGRENAERKLALERAEADAYATRILAEMHCPADLVEFGKNHGIPVFAEVTWQAGFMAGWRMAIARGWHGFTAQYEREVRADAEAAVNKRG